jgi:mannose-6-phosphate isomerase-like protein (cupin superfamily)
MTVSTKATGAAVITLAEARALPIPPGRASSLVFAHGTLEMRLYAPRDEDRQTPHSRDEGYIIAAGTAVAVGPGVRNAVSAGDFFFVAAGETHRFEELSPDFETWVIFYGPEGGEKTEIA